MNFVQIRAHPISFLFLTCHHWQCRFDVLGLHEFDSDRKRMSVILGCPDNTVKVFVKGADTSMFSIIDKFSNMNIIRATESHLHNFSSLGLRTLVVGMRDLNGSEFEQWKFAFETASTALIGRAALLRKIASNIENNLSILGASGIEDKLQQGVPEAIESLRMAGIKVWVLTGDKQETAISIGYSSKLLTSNMTRIIINNNSKESCKKSLEDAIVTSKTLMTQSGISQNTEGISGTAETPVALIIDGTSLVYVLDGELEEQVCTCKPNSSLSLSLSLPTQTHTNTEVHPICRFCSLILMLQLFQLASGCSVVLCCRVAPLQKAGIVALIKKRTDDMTLAIGDGEYYSSNLFKTDNLCLPKTKKLEGKKNLICCLVLG